VTFIDKLSAAWNTHDSLLCVGLDPDISKFPAQWKGKPEAIVGFCKGIIDATADVACSFKPQIAYFAALRAEDQLEEICAYIREKYPAIPVVLDAKRGDIGATAEQYAREAFERYGADAVTVSPYMGFDSVAPYLEWKDRGAIVLCRTSNAGGSDLQFLKVDGVPLYQHVARLVADKWNTNGQCGLVVGATFPEELAQVRNIIGDMPLLVPGVGAEMIVLSFAVVATAGLGQIEGTLITALLIGLARSFAVYLQPEMEVLVPYLIMVLVLLFRPQGLFSVAQARRV